MKNKWIFLLWFISLSATLSAQSAFQHKSAEEIAVMTPEQRVIEYCTDYANHGPHLPNEYNKVLDKALFNDGVKVFPYIIKIFNEFKPDKMKYGWDKRYRYFEGATFLLADIDSLAFRIRSVDGGLEAISTLRSAIERIRTAINNNKSLEVRLRISENTLSGLNGYSLSDHCVMNTLKKKYEISLTAIEQYEFINFLATREPYYPSKGERVYRKKEQECEYEKAELFHEAYLAYKASKK